MIDTELAALDPPKETTTATTEEYEAAVAAAKEKYLAITFLDGTGEHQHEIMMQTLENDYLRGIGTPTRRP